MENNIIYGVKSKGKFHYIGKRNIDIKKISDVKIQYFNSELRKVIVEDEDVKVIKLKEVNGEWYNEKLLEVIEKHKDGNSLLNPQWMLEGKRGFWEGKTRDENTMQKLSESKYKKIIQYDINGLYVKTFNSIKEVAINVFNDYIIKNGSACSSLYHIIITKKIKNRFRKNSYWFKEDELLKTFGNIPIKLNIDAIKKEELKIYRENKKLPKKRTHTTRKTVVQYNEIAEIINNFDNTAHAAYELKISISCVQRLCRGFSTNDNYILGYGESKYQSAVDNYPDYEIDYKPQIKEQKFRYTKTGKITYKSKTRTYYTILQFDLNNNLIERFTNISDANLKLKISKSKIGSLCRNNGQYKDYVLKYGEKIQVNI